MASTTGQGQATTLGPSYERPSGYGPFDSPETIGREEVFRDTLNWVINQGGNPYAIEDQKVRERVLQDLPTYGVDVSQYDQTVTPSTDPSAPAAGTTPGSITGTFSQGQLDSNIAFLDTIPNLTPEQKAYFIEQMRFNPETSVEWIGKAIQQGDKNSSEATDAENKAYTDRINEDQRVAAETRLNTGLSDIVGLQTQGDKVYGDQIARYLGDEQKFQGFLDNPSAMRSDAQLGSRLTEVESMLANQVAQTKQNAAKVVSQAGLRAAGKIDTGVRNAEQNATAMQGRNISGLLGEVDVNRQRAVSGRENSQTNQLGFNAGLVDARNKVLGGGVADLSAQRQGMLGQSQYGPGYDPQWSDPQLFGYDITGLNRANDNYNSSSTWSRLMEILGLGVDASNSMKSDAQGIVPAIGGLKSTFTGS